MKTTVVYHSADFDGLFCREIAKKFLPEAELIGWNFGDPTLPVPEGKVYVLDLPCDRPFGFDFSKRQHTADTFTETEPNTLLSQHFYDWVWIDHHKSSIESHPMDLPGYRIDGVAACRLAWQWFTTMQQGYTELPSKQDFIDRTIFEPWAVRLAGEYDIWDKRDPDAELFQHGLRSVPLTDVIWDELLEPEHLPNLVQSLLENGKVVQYAKTQENESIIKAMGFTIEFEGLKFLACNHARYNSHLFTAGLKAEHDACFGFKWVNGHWEVSLYHAPGKEHHDLSLIAVKYGGGGHRGACGFRTDKLPFIP